jgi:hydroxyacylglutathione hydrolase
MLTVIPFVLGPVETNAYLLGDDVTREAVVIDPAWDGDVIANKAAQMGWQIKSMWLTHAHFDHIAGAAEIARRFTPPPPIAVHSADLSLYQTQGGALLFGMHIEAGPKPEIELSAGRALSVGETEVEVRHTPGHTPGHVIFYCAAQGIAFCGDLIFQGSVGRTDLPGGSFETLISSIETQVFTLPDDTVLYPGHGESTTVGIERMTNPFLTS